MADPIKVIEDIIEAQDKLGDFIANGPGEGLPGFVRNQYRDRCNEFANAPQWAKNLNPIGQLSFGRFCRPYWDAQGVDGPAQEVPFEGGQCDAQLYVGSYDYDTGPEGSPTTNDAFFRAWGPIGGAVAGENSSGFAGVGLISRGSQQRQAGSFDCTSGTLPTLANLEYRQLVNGARNPRITSITACGADNCGNPPGELEPGPNPPPNPGPGPVGDPVDDPEGGPIPEIPIPPFNDPVGGPTEIDPGPDPTGSGGGAGNPTGGDGLPGEGDAVGGPAGGAAGGEDGEDIDFGDPPAGKVWVGALIECTVDPRLGNIPGTGPSNTVYPTAIANASLRYSTGYSTSQSIRSKWTELARPVTALVVEGCFVQAQPGVTASVRPISATICPENPCEE